MMSQYPPLRYICNMTPQEFIGHWSLGGGGYGMSERAGAQPHFIGLCKLLSVAEPDDAENYTFEKGTLKLGAKRGFADVFKRGAFAWEYKAPNGDLQFALRQLKDYANALDNPPLLIVSDRLRIEVHTQFIGRPTETLSISIKQLADPAQLEILRRVFESPQSFEPKRTNRDITEQAAKAFADVAERMRNERRIAPDRVAHFLTQCLFCFFAEDVGLLPERLFEKLVAKQITPEKLRTALIELFTKMRDGGLFGADDIPWFNGGLFKTIDVPEITPLDVAALKTASQLNWSAIDVAIFGTLFERGLDPKKRSQLGAHYTDPATIMRIVTPVVDRPLRAQWASAREEIAAIISKSKKYADAPFKRATERFNLFLEKLEKYRVLDPACGSGNFLYLALKTLKDIEHSVHVDAQELGLARPINLVVSPANVLGIEINEYAAELARVTVWIGELQWRLTHGYPFKQNPVLEPLDHIECKDALLTQDHSDVANTAINAVDDRLPDGTAWRTRWGTERGDGTTDWTNVYDSLRIGNKFFGETAWPKADAVIGNPPFVGGSKKRRELGDETFEALAKIYEGRVPPGADLVCYWFDKAWQQMQRGELKFAGLVSTNSIRGGSNRAVLDAIVKDGVIFDAWSDEPWVNDGAAVRVSLVAFRRDTDLVGEHFVNGEVTAKIAADLTAKSELDVTSAVAMPENANASFQGSQKIGLFDVEGALARRWLRLPNPNGRSNADVLKPSWNGLDVTRRNRDGWIIDFGLSMNESSASAYEAPFEYTREHVKPFRFGSKDGNIGDFWWRHGRPRPRLREEIGKSRRYLAISSVSKHFVFTFVDCRVLPDLIRRSSS
jgi:SAM-dependent methyltransferase